MNKKDNHHLFLIRQILKCFHSITILRTQNRFIITEFHSTITTYMSCLFGDDYVKIWYKHQAHKADIYNDRICLILRLPRPMVDVSHYLIFVMTTVILTIVTNQMIKNITAQGPCKLPIPSSSIVPIVIP